MRALRGIPVSPGIAVAPVTVIGTEEVVPQYRSIRAEDVDAEIERFDQAVRTATEEIEGVIRQCDDELKIPVQILESHRDMVRDPLLREEVAAQIRTGCCSAEFAIFKVIRGFLRRFEEMESEYISQRSQDVMAIERELIHTLQGMNAPTLGSMTDDCVVICHDLTPLETSSMNKTRVKAFAIEVGGRTSHTAIMARALQIPAVVGIAGLLQGLSGTELAIVDGYSGSVILDPDEPTLKQYGDRASAANKYYDQLLKEVGFPSETEDGYSIKVAANVELPDEIHIAREWGAEGVGLYRTEFLYDGEIPGEEKQFRTYRNAIQELESKYLVIRVLDVGADKIVIDAGEQNPFLV